jgi:hypothetical protein
MRKVKDRQELNELYSLVQNKIEEYISVHRVSLVDLSRYVKSNIEEIVEECGLSGIIGSTNIVLDVVDHYMNSKMDSVMKFEAFRSKIM